MKRIILLVFLLAVCRQIVPAQIAETQSPLDVGAQTNNAPAMGENERIGFMAERDQAENQNAPSSGGLIVRTLGAMCLIVGLIFAVAFVLKKFNLVKTSDALIENTDLKVLTNVALGAKRTLSVVRFGDQTLLIGSTDHTISLIAAESGAVKQMIARSVADLLAEVDLSNSQNPENNDNDFELELINQQNRLRDASGERSVN